MILIDCVRIKLTKVSKISVGNNFIRTFFHPKKSPTIGSRALNRACDCSEISRVSKWISSTLSASHYNYYLFQSGIGIVSWDAFGAKCRWQMTRDVNHSGMLLRAAVVWDRCQSTLLYLSRAERDNFYCSTFYTSVVGRPYLTHFAAKNSYYTRTVTILYLPDHVNFDVPKWYWNWYCLL